MPFGGLLLLFRISLIGLGLELRWLPRGAGWVLRAGPGAHQSPGGPDARPAAISPSGPRDDGASLGRPQGPRIHLACLLWQASLSAKAVPRQLAVTGGLPTTPSHCPGEPVAPGCPQHPPSEGSSLTCLHPCLQIAAGRGAATGGGLGSQLQGGRRVWPGGWGSAWAWPSTYSAHWETDCAVF